METKELKNIVRILSTAYLTKKNNTVPSQEEIKREVERRTRWLENVDHKYSGEKGFRVVLKEIWLDPPPDFI